MNGVDRFDQLRSYYSIQRAHSKTWRPLLNLLIDITLVNAYKWHTANQWTSNDTHRKWLLRLVEQLRELGLKQSMDRVLSRQQLRPHLT